MGKDEFVYYTEAFTSQEELEEAKKKINADKHYVTLHFPNESIDSNKFILAAVENETGKMFFSAAGASSTEETISLFLACLTNTTKVLFDMIEKYHTKEEAGQAIAEVERMLNDNLQGRSQ